VDCTKGLARDVFDTFPHIPALVMTSPIQTAGHDTFPHIPGLGHDVTDTYCCAQNGGTRGRVFTVSIYNKQDEKLNQKLLCISVLVRYCK